jgi:hypothetical protein
LILLLNLNSSHGPGYLFIQVYLLCLELGSGCGLAAREEKSLLKKFIY